MKQALIYSLKVCGTSFFLMPILFILLLAVLPGYHVPELIGLMLGMYIVPQSLTFSLVTGAFLLIGLSIPGLHKLNGRVVKLILSVAACAISYCTLILIYKVISQPTAIDEGYLPLIAFCTPFLFCLWSYKFNAVTNNR